MCVSCSSEFITIFDEEGTPNVICGFLEWPVGDSTPVTYCGCTCANCCPPEYFYQIFEEGIGSYCYTSGESSWLSYCNTSFSLLDEGSLEQPCNIIIDPELCLNEENKCDCLGQAFIDAYDDLECPFLDDLFGPSVGNRLGNAKKYICCTELKRTITWTKITPLANDDTACCLGGNNEIDQQTFNGIAVGNLKINIEISIIEDNRPCIFGSGEEGTGDCIISFPIDYQQPIYYEGNKAYRECCENIIISSDWSSQAQESIVSFDLPNCWIFTARAPGIQCGEGPVLVIKDPCGITSTDPEGIVSGLIDPFESAQFKFLGSANVYDSIVNYFCPLPSYRSGTIIPTDFEEISTLSDQQNLSEGFLKFNNNETKKINKIYASKKNSCKKNITYKVQEWNDLEKSKKTYLKIKYRKLYCIFKITEDVIEKEDHYEFTVKHIYGKIPQDNTLLVIDFIDPPKTTSSLNKVNRMEILKRIRKTKI